MKKSIKKLVLAATFALTLAVIAPSISSISASAATKSVTANANYKKAPKIKKGTTKVTAKKNTAYTCFVAPKNATYTITISGIQTLKNRRNPDTHLGNFYVCKDTGYGPSIEKVSTNGGKAFCLWTATNASYNMYYKNSNTKTVDKYLASRYAKLKLKKGEKIYLKYFYTGGGCKYTLKVKY